MKKVGSHIRAIMLVLGLVLASIVGYSAPAMADTGGYPYASYYGPGTNPTNSIWTDSSGNPGSTYGYYFRNCTDFVAWKLSNTNGYSLAHAIGNAAAWGGWASSHGYNVNGTAAVGAVAWWGSGKLDNGYSVGSYGHVAWVSAISGSSVTIQEYNEIVGGVPDGAYHTRTITASSSQQVQYIHFKDSGTTAPSNLADGTYILASDTGHVYEMAGGSPIYVSSWSNVPSPDTISATYSQAQINAMPQYPKDGTVIRGYRTGAIYVVAGGFPFAVSNLSNVPYTTWTNVDASSLGQLRSQPADGTVIRNYGNGAIYVVSGGAAMGVSSLSNIPYTSWTDVDGWSIGNQLGNMPSNGTTFVDYSTGIVYVVANGFPFAVSSFSNIPPVGGLAYLDHWVLANQLRSTPPDGTVIRDYNSGAIYVVAGDSAVSVHTLSSVPYTSWTNIDASYAIPDQLANYPISGTYLEGYNSGDTFVSNGASIAPATTNSSSVVVDDYAIVNQLGGTE